MPYAPPLPTTYPQNMEQMLQDAEVRRLLGSADSQLEQVNASQGATSTAIEAANADGVIDVESTVVSDAVVSGDVPVAGILATSFVAAQGIRQIPGWDNTFKSFGADIVDGVFGLTSPSGLTPEVKLYVADYVQHRFINQRQREAAVNAWNQLQHVRHAKRSTAHARAIVDVNKGAKAADARNLGYARTYTDQRTAAAIAYANARAHGVGVAAEQYADRVGAASRQYAHDIAAQAQRNAEAHTAAVNARLTHDIMAATAAATAASIAAHLKPITQTLAQMKAQLDKLQTENDTCTEPMCETVGPESQWGKLLKKYAPSAILALIAAAILTDPEEAERAAVDAAEVLGPPIQKIIEAVLIPLGHGPITQPGEITSALGIPPIPGVGI